MAEVIRLAVASVAAVTVPDDEGGGVEREKRPQQRRLLPLDAAVEEGSVEEGQGDRQPERGELDRIRDQSQSEAEGVRSHLQCFAETDDVFAGNR